ncbi:MAG: hypothetical protein MI924_23560, partial [Chloroflexales bacterium]|nr:hypothetical protein [Chloroflexales bacterium]
ALAEEIGSKGDSAVAKRILGQIAAIHGKEYTAYFQFSTMIFTEIKNRFELARTQARYAEALAKHNAEVAVVYRKQAIDTFVAIGAQGELARLGFTYERSC